jgi:hypothetical protein
MTDVRETWKSDPFRELMRMMQEKPSETFPEYGELPDLARLSQLPAVPGRDTWWQEIRNAYGLQLVLLRDVMVKQNNFIGLYQRNMQALVTLIQTFADTEEEVETGEMGVDTAPETIADMVPANEPVPDVDDIATEPVQTPIGEVQVRKEVYDPWGLS